MNILEPTPDRRVPNKIRNRLVMAVTMLAVVATVLTVGGFGFLAASIGSINEQTVRTNQLVEAGADLRLSLVREQSLVIRYALAPSAAVASSLQASMAAETEAFIDVGRLASDDPGILTAATDARSVATEWRDEWAAPLMREAGENELLASRTFLVTSDRAFEPVLAAVAIVDRLTQERLEADAISLGALATQHQALIIPVVVGTLLLTALGGFLLIRSISGPLQRLNRTAQALTRGEDVTFTPERDDEIGGLAVVLERMRLEAVNRYKTARSEAETAATFNQLAELTSFAHDEASLVDVATLVLQRIAPSARGHVMLLNNSTNRLTVVATWGDDAPAIGSIAALDRTNRCPGIRRATAYVAEDASDELAVRCPAHPVDHGSVVCLPMPALGSIVGVIHLERPDPYSFATVEIQRASRVAEQTALALANARLMSTMEGLANTDPLTGMRNARFFDAYLEHEYTRAQRDGDSIGLLMLDVDSFKKFNDTYGHPAGDEALRALARTIRGVIRSSDVMARYGGEEFIIALHHATLEAATVIAEKIRAATEQTIVDIGPGRYARMTVSIGVAATDAHQVERKGLVSLADAALYRAKAAGRNRVEVAPSTAADIDAQGNQRRRRTRTLEASPVPFPLKRAARRAAPRSKPPRPAVGA